VRNINLAQLTGSIAQEGHCQSRVRAQQLPAASNRHGTWLDLIGHKGPRSSITFPATVFRLLVTCWTCIVNFPAARTAAVPQDTWRQDRPGVLENSTGPHDREGGMLLRASYSACIRPAWLPDIGHDGRVC
jgi:hypothetical protein